MEKLFLHIIPLLAMAVQLAPVTGHGYMINPPGRNCMWRVGFPCPVNYNDNELFCGGYVAHQISNNGKCGMCGDNFLDSIPRAHETGGTFGIALVTRRYYSGQIITIVIELTSNHKGYFIFKICSILYYKRECEDQALLDKNVLPVIYANKTLSRKYYIETTERKARIELEALLPPGYNCSRCCLQWTYVTGNSWGTCDDGTQAMGCGKQETFINCADVSIIPMPYNPGSNKLRHSYQDPKLTSTSRGNQYRLYYRDMTRAGAPMTALQVHYQRCMATRSGIPGQDESCQSGCLKYPPECPIDKCKCVKDVYATKEFASTMEMADQWCLDKCNRYPAPECDETKCVIVYTKTA